MSDDKSSCECPGSLLDPKLVAKLQDAMQSIATSQLAHERACHTLQPTALVNELWLRILKSEDDPPVELPAFKAWAATAIRNILISHARKKRSIKRGGDKQRVLFRTDHGVDLTHGIDLIDFEEEMILLERQDPRAAKVVEMRFYGGMSHAEIAGMLGISERSSQQSWAMARSWLSIRLRNE